MKNIFEAAAKLRTETPPLDLILYRSEEESQLLAALSEIAETLDSEGRKGVTLTTGDPAEVPALPALALRRSGSGSVTYLAAPAGPEEAPFLDLLLGSVGAEGAKSTFSREQRTEPIPPAHLTIFIASTCPHCPNAVRTAIIAALRDESISVDIIDIGLFPQLAEPYNLRTVPMTVIDGELLINEVVSVDRLLDTITARGTRAYANDILLSHIDNGNMKGAVAFLLDTEDAPRSFLALWKQSSLSTRMGLMLAAAQALEENGALLDPVVLELIALLQHEDDTLRGDTADLLGQTGAAEAKEPLKQLLRSENPDIVEIAEEALEKLTAGEGG